MPEAGYDRLVEAVELTLCEQINNYVKSRNKRQEKKVLLYQTLRNISEIKLKREMQCEENWGSF